MLMDGIFNVGAAAALPYNVWEVVQCGRASSKFKPQLRLLHYDITYIK